MLEPIIVSHQTALDQTKRLSEFTVCGVYIYIDQRIESLHFTLYSLIENPQVTEPNWRGNFETDRTSKIERTTEGYHSLTKSRRTSRPSQRRNTYKYVEYQPGTTKPGW